MESHNPVMFQTTNQSFWPGHKSTWETPAPGKRRLGVLKGAGGPCQPGRPAKPSWGRYAFLFRKFPNSGVS